MLVILSVNNPITLPWCTYFRDMQGPREILSNPNTYKYLKEDTWSRVFPMTVSGVEGRMAWRFLVIVMYLHFVGLRFSKGKRRYSHPGHWHHFEGAISHHYCKWCDIWQWHWHTVLGYRLRCWLQRLRWCRLRIAMDLRWSLAVHQRVQVDSSKNSLRPDDRTSSRVSRINLTSHHQCTNLQINARTAKRLARG